MSVIFFIKTTFKLDLNHILNCVNKCDFGTKCFAKVEHFVLRLILTTNHSPANMIQAMRDYFGAHTFERVDSPRGEFFHEHWEDNY